MRNCRARLQDAHAAELAAAVASEEEADAFNPADETLTTGMDDAVDEEDDGFEDTLSQLLAAITSLQALMQSSRLKRPLPALSAFSQSFQLSNALLQSWV